MQENKYPNVSIIIANRNGAGIIGELLDSVYAQTYPIKQMEIICVDDCSDDTSCELIHSRYPDVHVVKNTRRLGPAKIKNIGIEYAKGEWLLFLDNDVVLEKKCLESLVSQTSTSDAVCFQPKLNFFHDKNVLNSTGGVCNKYCYAWDRGIGECDAGQYDTHTYVFFATSAAMLVKRDILNKIGTFDPDYYYLSEDLDLCFRMQLCGMRVVYISKAVCWHRGSHTMGRNNSTVSYLSERNRLITMVKNYQWRTLLRLFPGLIALKVKKCKQIAVQKRTHAAVSFFIALRIGCWFILHLFSLLIKRRRSQKLRTIKDEQLFVRMGTYAERMLWCGSVRKDNELTCAGMQSIFIEQPI